MAHIKASLGPKIEKKIKFELGEMSNVDHHFRIKFHDELNCDSLDVLKRCLDPEMDHEGPM